MGMKARCSCRDTLAGFTLEEVNPHPSERSNEPCPR
jgi:hypothetical protein